MGQFPGGYNLNNVMSSLLPGFMFGLQSQDFMKSVHRIHWSCFPFNCILSPRRLWQPFETLTVRAPCNKKIKKLQISRWQYIIWPNNALESSIYILSILYHIINYAYYASSFIIEGRKEIPTGCFPQHPTASNKITPKVKHPQLPSDNHPTASYFLWWFSHLKRLMVVEPQEIEKYAQVKLDNLPNFRGANSKNPRNHQLVRWFDRF